jgi:hypothetical protein
VSETTTCPAWCTVPNCKGGDCNRYQLPNIAASRSQPTVIDERGAIMPAVGVGIFSGDDPTRGTGICMTVGGVTEQLVDLEFTTEEAFTLAMALLDNYAMVIHETERPAPPWPAINDLRPTVERIEHDLAWRDRPASDIASSIADLKDRLGRIDPVADTDVYNRMFDELISLEHRRRASTGLGNPA